MEPVYTNDTAKKLTVMVCETQPVTAQGLKTAIESCPDLEFMAATGSLQALLEAVKEHQPDIVILDKAYGMQATLECVNRVHDIRPPAMSIIWGNTVSEAEALRFLQHGARGILRKTADVDNLIACLRAVGTGTTWMEDAVFHEMPRRDSYSRSELTPREQQVMGLVEQGLKNKEIGRELGICPGTVKIHLKHIFEKTGVRGRYGLAIAGLKQRGLIPAMAV
jgi:DNA-binding NarL/FixJ family response regulator